VAGDGQAGTSLFHGELTVEDLVKVRRQLVAWAHRAGLSEDTADAFILSGYEALANAVEHAYREEGHGPVEVYAMRLDRFVALTVTDHGRWRPPKEDRGTRGHGLALIRKLGSHTSVRGTPQGTTVRVTWRDAA
jgi:anti-sigma regulatory factor (Ser/Thr protein kinase)